MAGQILEVGALIYKLFVQFLIMQHLQIIALKEATLFVVIFKDANYSKKGLSWERDLEAKPTAGYLPDRSNSFSLIRRISC